MNKKVALNLLIALYRFIFIRKSFVKLHLFLYRLSRRGLGMMNSESFKASGEKHFLEKYLDKKTAPIVIDVGANQGDFSKLVLEVCQSARVYAFEPHPLTYAQLENNLRGFSVQTINAGCGDKTHVMEIFDYSENDGSRHASLYYDVIADKAMQEIVRHEASIVRLDDYLSDQKIGEVELLKVDAEGYEFNVLRGVENHIERGLVRAILFEFSENCVYSRVFFKDFFDMLHDFNIYRLLPSGLIKIDRYNPRLHEQFAYQNLAAIKPEHDIFDNS